MKIMKVGTTALFLICTAAITFAGLPEIIAHRGASFLAPENTMASVMLAWELGTDAIEIDVYLSGDGRIVTLHDKTTKRTGNADYAVAETDSSTLRTVDVGSFKDEKYAGERIPFLEEVVASIPKGKRLYIEVKCGKDIVPVLKEAVEKSGKIKQISVISFNFDVCCETKKAVKGVPVYWLASSKKNDSGRYLPYSEELLDKSIENKLDGLDLHSAGITADFMRVAKRKNVPIYCWTVDSPEEAERLSALGVKGITTNRPKWLKEKMTEK
ncbi:MAG: glycerophosphodiester phosphodiesterase family protein [Phycisphaerae bacterium]